jgi:hypothetical protein
MGDKKVAAEYEERQMREFTLGVLNDLQALEAMLKGGMLEEGVRRIGAEQEMFLCRFVYASVADRDGDHRRSS